MTHRNRGLARGVRETAGTGIVFALAGAAAWLSLSVIAAPADAVSQAARVSSGVPKDDAGFRVVRDMTAACTNCDEGPVPAAAVAARPSCERSIPEPLRLAAAHSRTPEVVWQSEAGNSYWARGERDASAHQAWERGQDRDTVMYRALWIQGAGIVAVVAALKLLP